MSDNPATDGCVTCEMDHRRVLIDKLTDALATARAEVDRWRNCFICIECGRYAADEDGACSGCGRDLLCFINGMLMTDTVRVAFDMYERQAGELEAERDALRARAESSEKERDELTASVDRLRECLALYRSGRIGSEELGEAARRDTAEAIAAWLEKEAADMGIAAAHAPHPREAESCVQEHLSLSRTAAEIREGNYKPAISALDGEVLP